MILAPMSVDDERKPWQGYIDSLQRSRLSFRIHYRCPVSKGIVLRTYVVARHFKTTMSTPNVSARGSRQPT